MTEIVPTAPWPRAPATWAGAAGLALLLGFAAGCVTPGASTAGGQDPTPPTIRIVQPADGARVEGGDLIVEVEYEDRGSGISAASFRAVIGGRDYSRYFDHHSRGATGRIATTGGLALGKRRLAVEVADRAGNVGRAEVAFFNSGGGWLRLADVLRTGGGPIEVLALAPGGSAVVAGGVRGILRILRLSDSGGPVAAEPMPWRAHRRPVDALVFIDERELASAGSDRTIRVWDLAAAGSSPRYELVGHPSSVTVLAVARGAGRLVSTGLDRTIRFWDLRASRPRERKGLRRRDVKAYALALTADGRILAAGGGDGTIRVWDLAHAEPTERALLGEQDLTIRALTFTPDGRMLASGSVDGTVRVWDLAGQPRHRARLGAHDGAVLAVSFAPGGESLASLGADGWLRLWSISAGELMAETTLPRAVAAAAANDDGWHLATAHEDGSVYILRLDPRATQATR